MALTVRPASSADLSTIVRFNTLMALETEGITLDDARLRAGIQTLIEDPQKGLYYIAEDDGAPAGQLMITYEWSDWRNGTFWWIQSVYVEKRFRSRGVFTTLYRHIERLARSQRGVCGLRLYVEGKNDRARGTYEHLGMHRTKYDMMEVDFVL